MWCYRYVDAETLVVALEAGHVDEKVTRGLLGSAGIGSGKLAFREILMYAMYIMYCT